MNVSTGEIILGTVIVLLLLGRKKSGCNCSGNVSMSGPASVTPGATVAAPGACADCAGMLGGMGGAGGTSAPGPAASVSSPALPGGTTQDTVALGAIYASAPTARPAIVPQWTASAGPIAGSPALGASATFDQIKAFQNTRGIRAMG